MFLLIFIDYFIKISFDVTKFVLQIQINKKNSYSVELIYVIHEMFFFSLQAKQSSSINGSPSSAL